MFLTTLLNPLMPGGNKKATYTETSLFKYV